LQIVGFWRFGNGNGNLGYNVCLKLFSVFSRPSQLSRLGL
jgi:hypothetical protein